jgi:hypothetical protein
VACDGNVSPLYLCLTIFGKLLQGTNAHVVLETAGAAFDASLFAGRRCAWRRNAFWYAPAPHALQQGGVRVMPGELCGLTVILGCL